MGTNPHTSELLYMRAFALMAKAIINPHTSESYCIRSELSPCFNSRTLVNVVNSSLLTDYRALFTVKLSFQNFLEKKWI